jgi:acetoin utilization deacetylase AcuC-like enzyme
VTLLYTDPLFQEHDTGNRHPETARRLTAVVEHLDKTGLATKCSAGTYKPLAEEQVTRVHSAKQIQAVKQLAEQGGGHLDNDTPVSSASFRVALAAAGACVAAVDAVMRGPQRSALCLVRPPGHHATPTHSMGFCLLNSIALAADHARAAHQLTRILIVDWDVHHGNGTQDVFFEDPEVAFLSIHRYGQGFYPGTGAATETGRGKGAGRVFNEPLRFGTPRHDYLTRFSNVLEKAATLVKPELVLVSAGFDAHVKDPIGGLGLEVEDFVELTKRVLGVARAHAGGRVVSGLEGGYNLEILPLAVQAHLEALLAASP